MQIDDESLFIFITYFQEVILSNPDSVGYKAWQSPQGDAYRQFWFFDLQNAASVKSGSKPSFKADVGPFTYK